MNPTMKRHLSSEILPAGLPPVTSPDDEAPAVAANGRRIGEVILDLQNISLSFGGVKALTDISFDVREHEIRAIIGPNGAGKTT
ncbi:ATP-binding cassette domain-containing protein, partial [Herbaspirillum sp. UBA812]|uniref:ATP-binding cassette domain-containing protein n=1 Tax=Herbaspirillum sp. UBA812 TaxID=1946590 RepID=UPI00257A8E05